MKRLVFVVVALLVSSASFAQRGPRPDPIVPEGVTVRLAGHTYAIPDGGIGGVPNVGIVVGNRATLVIDPGMGRPNGEAVLREVAKVSRNSEVYIATTHFHAEHTTGYHAFPATAKYINSTTQEAEFAELGRSFVAATADSSVRAWLAAFEAFEKMGPGTIVPAHGPIGDDSLIPTLRTIMNGIVTRTRELKAAGRTPDQIAVTLQMEFEQMHPTWARANGVAAIARVAYDDAR